MAATKKYAGLPDLDDAGTELYQTPGLTDDASTIQTSTVRSDSPTPSVEANDNLDRTQVDRDEARRRFEPAVVDARDVNFSYAIGGNQKSYISRHRRRRRARRSNGVERYGDLSDGDDSEDDESLGQRLARLKREAEEIRLEIERREKEDGEFQDSFEHQDGGNEHEDHNGDFSRDVHDLTQILDGLQTSMRSRHGTIEEELKRKLDEEIPVNRKPVESTENDQKSTITTSTISSITAFSDRLTTIESALGLPSLPPTFSAVAILPTLDTLNNQINLLSTTISPKTNPSSSSQSATHGVTSQMPHLDILQSRLHTLHQSATSLLNIRKSAHAALQDMEETRLRHVRISENVARFQHLANRRKNRAYNDASDVDADDSDSDHAKSHKRKASNTSNRRGHKDMDPHERVEVADELLTPLFLEDQAERIKALYGILPTIQDLQPLLPVVLERLRGLSIVHAGAADARNDMNELESRLGRWEEELEKWRGAVEGVERGIGEAKGVMSENVDVVGGLVRALEERVGKLEGSG